MTRTAWAALSRSWTADRGLSILLAVLFLLVFVLPPLGLVAARGHILGDVVSSLLLISGAAAVSDRKLALVAVSAVAAVALLARWAYWILPFAIRPEWRLGTDLAFLGLLTFTVLVRVFRAGPVTIHRIQGAVAAYLLLGLSWAVAYELVALGRPGAFLGASAETAIPGQHQVWAYFSFVTLTTVGYGDVTPVHPVARSLAVLEALLGQLYPAILLARLVSLYQRPTAPDEKP
jgi:hypothetical protein